MNRSGRTSIPKTARKLDGEKILKFIQDNKVNQKRVCETAGLNHRYLMDCAKRSWANVGCWRLICMALSDVTGKEIPEDYFDYHEPEKIEVSEPDKDACRLSDVKDVLISLLVSQKKNEALLLDICNTLKSFYEEIS